VIQVGLNTATRVVKIRVPDDRSEGDFLVVSMSPDEARGLADIVEEVPVLRLNDGRRWSEHALLPETQKKVAADLRRCADQLEGPDAA
jgi:hypothetical protein